MRWLAIVCVVLGCSGQPIRPNLPPPAAPDCPRQVVAPDEPEALSSTGRDKLTLVPATFADLPGWAADQSAGAVAAFLASCRQLAKLADDARVGSGPYGGRAKDWRPACRAAQRLAPRDHTAARRFFEQYFVVYAAHGKAGPVGKMTGYYVQSMRGSMTRGGRYQFPIFSRPADLVSVSLDRFVGDGRSRRVWGRVDERGQLVPYPKRPAFRARKNNRVLLWVDDPMDALSVEIEGSGRVTLSDGKIVWLHFAGKNGHRMGPMRDIKRAIRALGKKRGSRAWSSSQLARLHRIADRKRSQVFFHTGGQAGAIGSQNVELTPERSIAVDRAAIALSTPVFIETRVRKTDIRQLFIAQDTGGNILGTVRADIYWGTDAHAIDMGNHTNAPGRMWLLLPRGMVVPGVPSLIKPPSAGRSVRH